jgi:hypothetical protein
VVGSAGLADQANALCCPYAGGGCEVRESEQAGTMVAFQVLVSFPKDVIWSADEF